MDGRRAALVGLGGVAVILVGAAGCLRSVSSGSAGGGAQCRTSAQCTEGKVCVSGICSAPGMVKPGRGCTATRDCGEGEYCSPAGSCEVGGDLPEGAACAADSVCKPPLRCNADGFSGVCAPGGVGDLGATCQDSKDCLTGLWCARDRTCQGLATAFPPYQGTGCSDEGPFRAYFELPRLDRPPTDFFRLPFPNDVRVTDGRLNISDFPRPGPTARGVDFVQLYADAWAADFDGFSGIGAVTFRLSGEVDFDSATPSTVLYVDLTPGETRGRTLGRSWVTIPERSKFACANRFVVRNPVDDPLLPRHTYAVILTTALRSSEGSAPQPDADLALLLSETAPTDVDLKGAWDAYKPLRDWLHDRGGDAPMVAAATVFTVQDAPGNMQRLAASVVQQPPPLLSGLVRCAAGVKSPCDDGTPARACPAAVAADFDEIHGKLRVPIYQQGTAPYEKPSDGGGISAVGGLPAPVGTADVCFALSLPKTGAAPAEGWPLIIHHHDTGGSMRSFIEDGIAATVARGPRPGAVLGFDAVEHGARRGVSTKLPEQLMLNLLNPRAARDNVLQGAVDVLQALRVANLTVEAALSPTGAPIKFDAGSVAFFGHGQGSTSGTLALAFSDAAPAVVLSGAGSHVAASLMYKTGPVDVGAGLRFLVGEPVTENHPVMTLLQSFFERSDPLFYNRMLVQSPPAAHSSKHVFMSWGTGDTSTPPQTLRATAVSLGIPPALPVLEPFDTPPISRPVSANVATADSKMRTAAVFQYSPAPGRDGHRVALENGEAITDWAAFLTSFLVTGTPSVP